MLCLLIYIVGFLFFAYALGAEACELTETEERVWGLAISTVLALLWPVLLVVMIVVALQLRLHGKKIEGIFNDD